MEEYGPLKKKETKSSGGGVKHPNIKVKLTGSDGNAFAILGKVIRALRTANLPKEEIDAFTAEATSGDYDHLLQTCMKWVNIS